MRAMVGAVSLGWEHIAGLVATLAVIVGITMRAARTVKSAEGFSVHGRRSGAGLIAGGIAGTCIGGSMTVGTAQGAFLHGVSACWFSVGTATALILLALFYAKALRASRLVTMPQFLAQHYGPGAGPLVSLIGSAGTLLSSIATVLSGIAVVQMVIPVPDWAAVAIIMVLSVESVFLGGLKSIGVAGMMKISIMLVCLTLAGAIGLAHLAALPDLGATFPRAVWFNPFRSGVISDLGDYGAIIVGVVCTQTHIQAIYSATKSRDAVWGALIAGLVTLPIGALGIAVGMAMRAAHPEVPSLMALPMFFVLYLPPWLAGVGLAGLLLAVVGSVAGLSLGIGTMIINDIVARFVPAREGAGMLWLNRAGVAVAATAAAFVALSASNTDVLQWNYLSMGLRGSGVFLPMTLAIFCPGRLPARWAVLSMVVSAGGLLVDWLILDSLVNPMLLGLGLNVATVGLGLVMGRRSATPAVRGHAGVEQPS